jgi:hypothetical protein
VNAIIDIEKDKVRIESPNVELAKLISEKTPLIRIAKELNEKGGTIFSVFRKAGYVWN